MTTVSSWTGSGTNSETPQSDNTDDYLGSREERERKQKLQNFVTDQYTRCKNARTKQEREWYKNLAFYGGEQWITWIQSRFTTPKPLPWRVRLTINRIKPIIRTELSRVTSQKPNASVVPASSEDEDLFAAQAGEQVWESFYNRKQLHRTFSRTAWWMLLTGTGFLKTYWDESVEDVYSNVYGDVEVENVTPFHLFVPDLLEPELEKQLYVIHAKTVPILTAKALYPQYADKFVENCTSAKDILDDFKLNISGNNKPDSVLMLEMWLKPGAHTEFPKGGRILVVGDFVVAEDKGLPYSHGQFPFVKFEHIPTGGFYSESVITSLIPLQREYNRTRSQIVESKNRMGKPQLLAPRGSVVASKITTEPGQLIEYTPGFEPPRPMPLQPLPAYILQELDRIILDMEDLSAQHQVSKGQTPAGVTAATAISYLQERDDSVLSHTYDSVEFGYENLAKQVLGLCVQYWDTPRMVKVVGTDGAHDALTLKSADIKSGTDIRMEAGSALPTSKAAKQAFIMDLMKMGFIPPEKGLEMLEIGGVQRLYDQIKIDERQAQRENLKMKLFDAQLIGSYRAMQQRIASGLSMQQEAQAQSSVIPPELAGDLIPDGPVDGNLGLAGLAGQEMPVDPSLVDQNTGQPMVPPTLVPVNTWDNHAIHIEVHNRFRKGQAFETLSEEHKALFEDHVRLHEQEIARQQMGMMPPGPMPQDNMPPQPPAGGSMEGMPNG